ncbi:hypothetical protein AS589_09390 [Empedobacter brevis]|uniref:hypothetical protein n=1 Tax=Empedobacter brevis TaxID=247 RepID=UPI00131FCEE6|nr:hypothetical protein [Empedobacter brevis]QHC84968.1 hypothetical protein AS589_09390 [Empedobacter brevis]
MSNKRIPPSPPLPAQPRVINESKIPKRATSIQTPVYKSKPKTIGVERPSPPKNEIEKAEAEQLLKLLFLIIFYAMLLIFILSEICQ